MSTAEAVADAELASLFSGLDGFSALMLAVSGGPDSTALMLLASRWRETLDVKPKLVAVTVDHGLRMEAKAEAQAVGKLARKLGMAHRTLRWTGKKPKTGLQQAARAARYRLLAQAARKAGAGAVLTAHTLDDQAETVLIRMMRGSGIAGLGAMQKISVIPGRERSERARNPYAAALRSMDSGPAPSARPGMTESRDALYLIRPLLDTPKARLIATLRAAKIAFADDPSNRDPRFTRARLRGLMPELAQEGLDASRLALLARRLKRADVALEEAVDEAAALLHLSPGGSSARGDAESLPPTSSSVTFDAAGYARLAAEVGLRLLGRAIAEVGTEGPVELAKLEALKDALDRAQKAGNVRFRRSLAGAIVTLKDAQIAVEKAPPRRIGALTTRRRGRAKPAKTR